MDQNDYMTVLNQAAIDRPGEGRVWLDQQRLEARQQFSCAGFPSPREEEWRYTNISPIEKKQFAVPTQPGTVDAEAIEAAKLDGCDHLVFIDGHFDAGYSSVDRLPDGATLVPISQAFDAHEALLQSWMGQSLKTESHGFIHFNTASFTDGVLLHLDAKVRLNRPIHVLFVVTEQATPAMVNVRNVIVAETGAKGHLIESYVHINDACYLQNAVTELFVAQNAQLSHSRFQNESTTAYHFGGIYAKLQEHAILNQDNFTFGAALSRSEVHADLETASDCSLDGLYIGVGRQHMDQHTRLNHLKPHAMSREFYKGILDDRARGVFQGRIVVAEGACKTDADMGNRNLLLSDKAEADTKPQLEIYNDDVKCAHGVTIGQLDETSIFYLRSRAVDEETARNMLTFAFANEMVERIEFEPLRMRVLEALLSRFPQQGMRKEWL